jgi:hypothetical protein
LQKYRFSPRAGKPILSFHQNEEASAMSAFWTHLQRLAQGQLFNGGYLRPDDAMRTAPADVAAKPVDRGHRAESRNQHLRSAQVTACP